MNWVTGYAVSLTDLRKHPRRRWWTKVHDDEAGGAIGVFKSLVDCDVGDKLDPVLMTGSTLLVDDDLSERFLNEQGIGLSSEVFPSNSEMKPWVVFITSTGQEKIGRPGITPQW